MNGWVSEQVNGDQRGGGDLPSHPSVESKAKVQLPSAHMGYSSLCKKLVRSL